MNVAHLRYAIEVSKTGSVSKAAENLFIGQPNLSKAIKELEEDFGFTIFNRTSKGVIPTEKGVEFLAHAKRIVAEINEFEELYRRADKDKQTFRISVPRCPYMTEALSGFVGRLDPEIGAEICFSETGAMDAVSNLLTANYNFAIIRIKSEHEPRFAQLLKEKELKSEQLFEFRYRVVMSKDHGLAKKSTVTRKDLDEFTEIVCGDDTVLPLTVAASKKPDGKQIRVSDRSSQYELLSAIPDSFMWELPVKAETLDRYGLVQRDVADADNGEYLLINPRFYKLTKLDRMYLEEISRVTANFNK